jgi:RNase P/RNase MRP subunit p30
VRHYVDLHLKPQTPEAAQEMETLAVSLGYSHVASTKPAGNAATRIDVEAKRGKELQDALKRNRRRCDILAVRCLSKEVARQAAKDDRIDIILFPDDPAQRKQNHLDTHEAGLLDGSGRAYEVNLCDLLAASPTHLSKMITLLKKDLAVATKHDIPLVLSSGASTPLSMREPRAFTALASLLDIDEEYAADMISVIPEAILERNHAKLHGEEP